MESQIRRQPRPMGLTLLSLNYQKSSLPEDKDLLLKHLITQYTLQGFRFNNKPIDIPTFSKMFNLEEELVLKYIAKVGASIGAFNNPEQIQDTLNTIASLSTNWAIEDRGLAMQQITILKASQGNKYSPFISGELNRALSLGQSSNKNFMELYKTFFTSSNTNILNIYNDNKENDNYINPLKAFEILQEQLALNKINQTALPTYDNKKLIQEEELDLLFQKHHMGETPGCQEKRTGADALMALEPIGPQAVTIPISALKPTQDELKSLKAPRRNTTNRHEQFEERRGQTDYVDYDEVD